MRTLIFIYDPTTNNSGNIMCKLPSDVLKKVYQNIFEQLYDNCRSYKTSDWLKNNIHKITEKALNCYLLEYYTDESERITILNKVRGNILEIIQEYYYKCGYCDGFWYDEKDYWDNDNNNDDLGTDGIIHSNKFPNFEVHCQCKHRHCDNVDWSNDGISKMFQLGWEKNSVKCKTNNEKTELFDFYNGKSVVLFTDSEVNYIVENRRNIMIIDKDEIFDKLKSNVKFFGDLLNFVKNVDY